MQVELRNTDIATGVSLHWHGYDVPNGEDGVAGVTQDAVMPGGAFTYRFLADVPGTYWYHSHQNPAESVPRGLFGTLVVLPGRPRRALTPARPRRAQAPASPQRTPAPASPQRTQTQASPQRIQAQASPQRTQVPVCPRRVPAPVSISPCPCTPSAASRRSAPATCPARVRSRRGPRSASGW
nr:hypothetical protein GCM10020093_111170 [Planobispora longispora]